MFNRANLTPVEAAPKAFGAAGGSSGKPGRCCASIAGPQADDTGAPAIALGTTRSTTNAPATVCSHGPVRLSLPPTLGSGARGRAGALTLPKQRDFESVRGFTLAELLVTMSVLVLLVFLFTQLLNSASTTMSLGNKRMDADSQARQLLDRMAIDFDQMLTRTDVSYFVKRTGNTEAGNDQIAFFSAVPGYYTSGSTSTQQGPVSLVAYRVNSSAASSSYNKMERLGKGLVWNRAAQAAPTPTPGPLVFLPLTISNTWPYATNQDPDPNYEVIGPDVFRFEYYYLLSSNPSIPGTANQLSAGPWSSTDTFLVKDVAAIVVAIAVIEPKSRVLLRDSDLTSLGSSLIDFGGTGAPSCPSPQWQLPGQLLAQWQCVLDANTSLPRPAISGIRLYERYFYLSQ